MSEFEFINWLKSQQQQKPKHCVLGPGDDTAILDLTSYKYILYASDMILEDVHFTLNAMTPEQIGRKALAVNISDIAAMGGVPLSATISFALPHGTPSVFLKKLYTGILDMAKSFDISLAGGDTTSWNQKLAISISLIGYANSQPIRRSGAKPGNGIYVTGSLGGSIHGKHFGFTPRVKEAATINRLCKVTAMIDISDGTIQDLNHILTDSKVGATLDKAKIPISENAKQMASSKEQGLNAALCDGEDFELLFTVDDKGNDISNEINKSLSPDGYIAKIGSVTVERRLVWSDGNEPIIGRGFQHDF